MAEHKIGTREEWQAARDELAKLEAEQAERNEEIKSKRLDLPWVPVEKEYVFESRSEHVRNGRRPGMSSPSSRPSRRSATRRSRASVSISPGSRSRRSTCSNLDRNT